MRVLGIDTSCDDTALCLLEWGKTPRILAEEVSSQSKLHEDFGGVVPELAAREHLQNLPILLERVTASAGISLDDIDLIAVTNGPGLKGCLLTGVSFAKGLAAATRAKLLPVHHIEGHALSAFLSNPDLAFPYLVLIASGGHTEMHLVHGLGRYELIARTTDDAAGEAFDKSAHLLGFPYPGGPKLAQLADTVEASRFQLPRVMRERPEFSFSGLKTAIALMVERSKREHGGEVLPEDIRAELAFAVQRSILTALLDKVRAAVQQSAVDSLAVVGGVAANARLRSSLAASVPVRVFFPELRHCMDNAAMIAYTAGARYAEGERQGNGFGVVARSPLEHARPPADSGEHHGA